MKLWRVDYGTPHPVGVEAQEPVKDGHSNDADGKTIFSNTHFLSKEDAWQTLLEEVDAGETMTLRALRHLEGQVAKVRHELIEATKIRHDTRDAFNRRNEPDEVTP